MKTAQRILVLAPHTDDGELGCGATIAKAIEAGSEVHYVAFSTCAKSLPPTLPADTLAVECRTATAALGINSLQLLPFDVRNLQQHRQEILEELVRLQKEWKPDAVYLPARNDVHQDHRVIHSEGLRAFKFCSVFGYELPWNNVEFAPGCFERITQHHLRAKQLALQEYKSQSQRRYMSADFIASLAKVRGVQCNAELAEAFEVYRLIR